MLVTVNYRQSCPKEIYRMPVKFPQCNYDDYLHCFVKLLNDDIKPYLLIDAGAA